MGNRRDFSERVEGDACGKRVGKFAGDLPSEPLRTGAAVECVFKSTATMEEHPLGGVFAARGGGDDFLIHG